MTVEAVNEALEVQFTGFGSEITVVEYGLELASSVEATALVFPEYIQHLLNTCKGIFEPGKEGTVNWGQH
jgi:hypothetical protein